ncbi:MAG: NusG domain II-containing protein [Candidatus Izimaplasma sp.]|nr:NusG domain II-containing protein [Candidatus Izimaplasma bacterium]
MKQTDIYLIIFLVILGITSYFILGKITNESSAVDGTANVFYNDQKILEISLEDGSYEIFDESKVVSINLAEFLYTVAGYNGDVVIEYNDNKVRVIDEISPKHICRLQGYSNSPLAPITCLPNNIIIIIQAKQDGNTPDDISR